MMLTLTFFDTAPRCQLIYVSVTLGSASINGGPYNRGMFLDFSKPNYVEERISCFSMEAVLTTGTSLMDGDLLPH
jgi:hypothetical protein